MRLGYPTSIKILRSWLSVIVGGESLVSHAGGVLLVETARRTGLAGQLSRLLSRWRQPLAVHDPGKIVTDLAITVALVGVIIAGANRRGRAPRSRHQTCASQPRC